jgi:2'-5' RNA ligase
MTNIRTFVAVEINQEVRRRAADLIRRLDEAGGDVKWVETDRMHITLKFLGDVPETEVTEVCRAVAGAVEGFGSFEVRLRGAGAFPTVERPRTIWIGVDEGGDELIELQERIEAGLARLDYPPEARRFRPHLTLGRIRRGGRRLSRLTELLTRYGDFDARSARICEAIVFSSELTRQGPVYMPMGRSKLG